MYELVTICRSHYSFRRYTVHDVLFIWRNLIKCDIAIRSVKLPIRTFIQSLLWFISLVDNLSVVQKRPIIWLWLLKNLLDSYNSIRNQPFTWLSLLRMKALIVFVWGSNILILLHMYFILYVYLHYLGNIHSTMVWIDKSWLAHCWIRTQIYLSNWIQRILLTCLNQWLV